MQAIKDIFLKLPEVSLSTACKLIALSLVFFIFSFLLKPQQHYASGQISFEKDIPKALVSWNEAPQQTPQVRMVSDERSLESQLYDDMLMRSYVNKDGHHVMLALAYAHEQRQDVKVHQPDVCYPAQGYQMQKSELHYFDNLKRENPVIGKRQLYYGQNHLEAVSYWIRVGDRTLTSGFQMRMKIISDGLMHHRFDDGILVRVSSAITDESQLSEAYALHEQFLKEFVTEVESKQPGLLLP